MKKLFVFIGLTIILIFWSCDKDLQERDTDVVILKTQQFDTLDASDAEAFQKWWEELSSSQQTYAFNYFCEKIDTFNNFDQEDEEIWMEVEIPSNIAYGCCEFCNAFHLVLIPAAWNCPNSHCPNPCGSGCGCGQTCYWDICD